MDKDKNYVRRVVEKRGQATTIYRLPAPTIDEHDASGAAVTQLAEHAELVEHIAQDVESIKKGFKSANAKMMRDMIRGMLSAYQTDHLAEIKQALSGQDAVSHGVADQIMRNRDEIEIINALRLYPVLGVSDYRDVEALNKSVRHYWQLPELEFFYDAPDASKLLGIALMKVTHAIVDERRAGNLPEPLEGEDDLLRAVHSDLNHRQTYRIRYDEMIDLVIEEHARVDEITSIIRNHQATDPLIIRAILDGIAPSLAVGAL